MNIGLAGPPEAGKNATGDVLAILYGYRLVSFAEALRRELADVLCGKMSIPKRIRTEPSLEELHDLLIALRGGDPWKKPTPIPMRKALQLYGTEFRRNEDVDYWVKKVTVINPSAGTDVRFPNERTPFDEVWYIFNPEAERKAGLYRHASEGQILPQDCDRIIDNSGTLDDLERNVEGVMMHVLRH